MNFVVKLVAEVVRELPTPERTPGWVRLLGRLGSLYIPISALSGCGAFRTISERLCRL